MEEIILKPSNKFVYTNEKGSFKGSYIIKYVSIMVTADDPKDLVVTVKKKKAIEMEIVHSLNSKIKNKNKN